MGNAELIHQISTLPGHSGSAVLLTDQLKIAAIHKGGKNGGVANAARLVTPDLISSLQKEAERMGAVMFDWTKQHPGKSNPGPSEKVPKQQEPQELVDFIFGTTVPS